MSTTATTITQEQEAVPGDPVIRSQWQPMAIIDQPSLGVTIDDGCFVVLVRNHLGEWHPTKHIPLTVLGSLVEALSPDRLESD